MLSTKQLDDMSRIEIAEIDRNSLVDLSSVHIGTALPAVERMCNYLQQVKNPYLFRCGDMVVRVRFDTNGAQLDDILKRQFNSVKRG